MTVPIAAAEASAAGSASGAAGGGAAASGGGVVSSVKKAPGNPLNHRPGKRKPQPKPAAGTEARRQRDEIDAIKANRPADPDTKTDAEPSAASSPGGGRPLLGDVRVSSAGGGFVLGTFVYVLGLTYLKHGRAGVQAWLKAKFLNEVA